MSFWKVNHFSANSVHFPLGGLFRRGLPEEDFLWGGGTGWCDRECVDRSGH